MFDRVRNLFRRPIAIIVDTSGSTPRRDLEEIDLTIYRHQVQGRRGVVILCDSTVHYSCRIKHWNGFPKDNIGRGGTDLTKAIEFARKYRIHELHLYTDGEFMPIPTERTRGMDLHWHILCCPPAVKRFLDLGSQLHYFS